MKSPRRVAFDVLYKIETEESYSSIAVNKALKENNLNKLDSSFASAIIYGVLEKKITLDYVIRSFSSVRLKKIETKTLTILRMSVYQMLYMDKVPDNASVNEAVQLAKNLRLFKSSGFINGILRSISRAETKCDLSKIKNKIKLLSVKYSVPEDIIKLWLDSYGEKVTVDMLNSVDGRPPLYARVNTLLTDEDTLIENLREENIIAEKSILENVITLKNTGSVENIKAFPYGEFYIQDLSSNIALTTLSPKENNVVYDVCSAPGGKSFTSAILMNDKGKINSYDLYKHKIKLIYSTAKRLEISIINTEINDATSFEEENVADIVICDVPCSGLGLLRRKPEIRYKDNIVNNDLTEIQYKILCSSANLVRNGGKLMYSTCTLNPKENNLLVEKFLSEHKDFVGEKLILPKNIKRTIKENEYECSLFPQTNNSDGFYFAILRKGD